MNVAACPLCAATGETLVQQTVRWRVIRAAEVGFPAFYRLVWQGHVAEWSDLSASDRQLCGELLAAIEGVLRKLLRPDKVNIASLGNRVAHLHWHVVARFRWDSHWPQSVWSAPEREQDALQLQALEAEMCACDAAVTQALLAV